MSKTKIMCCSVCKKDDISWQVWADELNNVNSSPEDKFVYCDNCEEETIATLKKPVIRVYFETPNHSSCEEVATFTEEKYFDACYRQLEEVAKQEGYILTESFSELEDE